MDALTNHARARLNIVCRPCPRSLNAAGIGRCLLCRDDTGRTSEEGLRQHVESGVCPEGRFDQVNRDLAAGRIHPTEETP